MRSRTTTTIKASIEEYRAAYEKAEKAGKKVFTLKGVKIPTGYAKYHLQYLENKYNRKKVEL